MSKHEESPLTQIIDYMFDTYGNDGAERLSNTKMVAAMCFQKTLNPDYKTIIDKIAIFNGIKRAKASYGTDKEEE